MQTEIKKDEAMRSSSMTGDRESGLPTFVFVLRRMEAILTRALRAIVIVLILLSTGLALLGVVLRYGFGISYDLLAELARYFIVYAVLLYFGPLVTRNAHLSMSILPDMLSNRLRRYLDVLVQGLVSCLLMALSISAIQWELGLFDMGLRTMSGEMKAYIPSAALPVGVSIACLYTLLRTVYSAVGIDPNPYADVSGVQDDNAEEADAAREGRS